MDNQYKAQAWMTFDRPRLRKIIVTQNCAGIISIRVKILDRGTLAYSEARSYWTPATFEIVSALLLAEGVIMQAGANIKLMENLAICD